ncbi:hypothetical protein GCWU000325_00232 [Alloprevotella tannerae ATCC 51259]|uniref:Uncharacterized protein n=1 Tax=Alloprevotella tannerae ATCC 51259 TaxID=626522 RepID=C9LDG2_9BACT|nr:hypothetical protein GCWU000325_00232 [Alloprevotella tannerae ATCC 51259]
MWIRGELGCVIILIVTAEAGAEKNLRESPAATLRKRYLLK